MNSSVLKVLIFLKIFLSATVVVAEDRVVWEGVDEEIRTPDGEVTKLLIDFVFVESQEELDKLAEKFDLEPGLDGFSDCARDVELNTAWCAVYVKRPKYMDGYNTWTIGHEVLHGVYGPNIHD